MPDAADNDAAEAAGKRAAASPPSSAARALPRLLVQSENPFETYSAVVEDDGRTVYLYVCPLARNGGEMRAVWLANRRPASDEGDAGQESPNVSPRMVPEATRHAEAGLAIRAEDLSIVWLEDGEGVALLERDELLSLVPADAVRGSFPGFSREAVSRQPWAWPLDDGAFAPYECAVAQAQNVWQRWAGREAWVAYRDCAMDRLEARLGDHRAYFAVDGGKFPPLAVARFDLSEAPFEGASTGPVSVYATIGMGAFPMPASPRQESASISTPLRPDAARVEIVLVTSAEAEWAVTTLAWLGRYPWTYSTWLAERHIVASPTGHATWFAPDKSAALLLATPRTQAGRSPPTIEPFTDAWGNEVRYLFALFLTADQRKIAEMAGIETLLERLEQAGCGFITSAR